MKKRLFILPLFAGMVLSGCDFSVESLKFWEKKDKEVVEYEDNSTNNGNNNSGSTVDVTNVSLSDSSLSLKVGESKTLTATVSPSDATNKSVSWSSSAAGVASVSSQGLVTAVSEGTATITVTSAADSSKKASCQVTVSKASSGDSGSGDSGQSEGSVKTYSIPTSVNPLKTLTTDFGVTLTFNKETSSNDPISDNTGTARLYAKHTLKVSSSSGKLSKLEFTKGDYGTKAEATITPSTGSYSNYVWSGSASEIVYTVGDSGQWRFTEIKFTIGEGGGSGESGQSGSGESGSGSGTSEGGGSGSGESGGSTVSGTSYSIPSSVSPLESLATGFGVTLTFNQESSSNPPISDNTGTARMYANHTLTVSSSSGKLAKLEFTKGDYGTKTEATITPSTGSYSNYVWTGEASEIVFTVGDSGQWRFSQIKFTFVEGGGSGESGQGEGEGGSGEGGQTVVEESETLLAMKALITPIAADLFEIDESEVTYSEYDGEEYTDIYTHDESELTFVYLPSYTEESDVTPENIVSLLESYLPEGAVLDEEETYEEEGYYDRWYVVGDYYYTVYVCDYSDEEGTYIVFGLSILLKSQSEAFREHCYESEGDDDIDWDNIDWDSIDWDDLLGE